MAVIDYDKSPQITETQRLKSLKESVQRAFDEVDNSAITKQEIDALPMHKVTPPGGSGSGGGSTGGPVSWNDIVGKPSTFYPSAHTHVLEEITDMGSISNQDIDAMTNLEIEALINNMA